jgi:hypothetical protein
VYPATNLAFARNRRASTASLVVKSGINRQDWTAFSTKVLELDAEGGKIGRQNHPEPLAKVEAGQDRERNQAQGSSSRKTQARPKRCSRDPVVKETEGVVP